MQNAPAPPPGATAPPGSNAAGGPALAASGSATYTDAQGSFDYIYYVPSGAAGRQVPLVMALHGCLENPTNFEDGTRWFEDAQQNNYIVVMPAHPVQVDNPKGCWRYWDNHYRGKGEPEVLVGIVRTLALRFSVDPQRTYITGMSSGGAMTTALVADYPDVFAAGAVGSGTEYQPCATDDVGQCYLALTTQQLDQDPTASGKAAYGQDVANRAVIPVILFQGDADTVVSPFNEPYAVQSIAAMEDGWLSAGSFPGSFTNTATTHTSGQVTGGYSYDVYGADNGNLVWWVIHGMNHAWSGGVAESQSNASDGNNYDDPKGPSETAAFRAFLLAHTHG